MNLAYRENRRIRTPDVIYYDAFKVRADGMLDYASRWIEYSISAQSYTPCRWGQRLQPCKTFEQARKEMVAFEVIQRLDRA